MSKNKKMPVNIPGLVSAVVVLILLVSLWQNYSLLAYQAILEKNIFLLNENLAQYQRSEKIGPNAGSEAAAYLKWKFVLKEQVEQTAQILSDKATALKNAGKDKALASLIYYNAGLAQTMNSNFSDAVVSFEEAVKLDPKNGYAYYNLGMLYYTYKNDNAKALYCYKRYMEIFPRGIYSIVVRSRIKQLEESKP
jgi:tetratricopeptide (TPR) repeat protein